MLNHSTSKSAFMCAKRFNTISWVYNLFCILLKKFQAFEHVSQFVNHTIEHRLKSQVKPLKNRCYKVCFIMMIMFSHYWCINHFVDSFQDLKRRAPFRAHMEILHNYAMNDPVFKCDICKKVLYNFHCLYSIIIYLVLYRNGRRLRTN